MGKTELSRRSFVKYVGVAGAAIATSAGCLVGGLFYTAAIRYGAPTIIAQSGCALVVILIRLFAVKYHWQLPLLHAYRFNRFNAQKMHTGFIKNNNLH